MLISDIKQNDKNPRNISDDALNKLSESISRDPEFMELRPIVINKDNVIVGGNMRYRAIKKLGMNEIPDNWVVIAERLSNDQLKRFILVDNAPSGMSGDWDNEILNTQWDENELKELGFNIDTFKEEDIEPDDKKIEEKYFVFIECVSEIQQVELLDRFQKEGLSCKALIS